MTLHSFKQCNWIVNERNLCWSSDIHKNNGLIVKIIFLWNNFVMSTFWYNFVQFGDRAIFGVVHRKLRLFFLFNIGRHYSSIRFFTLHCNIILKISFILESRALSFFSNISEASLLVSDIWRGGGGVIKQISSCSFKTVISLLGSQGQPYWLWNYYVVYQGD